MSGLSTRVVVPLLPIDSAPMPALRLNPVFVIEGEKAVMTTQFLATISENELKKSVSNLRNHHQEISQALDLLFLGF